MIEPDATGDIVDPYRFVSLGDGGDLEVTQYVVDTNVISNVERLIRGGASDTTSRKAVKLCRDLASQPQINIVYDFAWIEGSSFHQPAGLSPTSIVIRDVAAALLKERPVDLEAMVDELSGWQLPDDYEMGVRSSLDEALSSMSFTVFPCYLAALVLEERYGNTSPSSLSADDVIAVVSELSTKLNYIPGVLLASLKLACIGTPESRTAMMRVLKTGRKTPRVKEYLPVRNALSAAWDLGVLQLLSLKLAAGINAELVTSDEALADTGDRISISSRGEVIIRESSLATTYQASTDAERIDKEYARLRSNTAPTHPTPQEIASAIQGIEKRIGSTSTLATVLVGGVRLDLSPIEFTARDLSLLTNFLIARTESEAKFALTNVLDDEDRLRGRFDAALMLAHKTVGKIAALAKVSESDVIQPLATRSEHWRDVATALLSFARADREPFTASVYRELLSRPNVAKEKLSFLVGGMHQIVMHWSRELEMDPGAFVREVEGQLVRHFNKAG